MAGANRADCWRAGALSAQSLRCSSEGLEAARRQHLGTTGLRIMVEALGAGLSARDDTCSHAAAPPHRGERARRPGPHLHRGTRGLTCRPLVPDGGRSRPFLGLIDQGRRPAIRCLAPPPGRPAQAFSSFSPVTLPSRGACAAAPFDSIRVGITDRLSPTMMPVAASAPPPTAIATGNDAAKPMHSPLMPAVTRP